MHLLTASTLTNIFLLTRLLLVVNSEKKPHDILYSHFVWGTRQLQVSIPNNGVVSGLLLVFIEWYQVSKGVAQVSRDVPSVFLWLVFAS